MKQTGCQEYQKVLSYFYDLVKRWYFDLGSKLPTERKIAEQLELGEILPEKPSVFCMEWVLLKGSRAPAIMLWRISDSLLAA